MRALAISTCSRNRTTSRCVSASMTRMLSTAGPRSWRMGGGVVGAFEGGTRSSGISEVPRINLSSSGRSGSGAHFLGGGAVGGFVRTWFCGRTPGSDIPLCRGTPGNSCGSLAMDILPSGYYCGPNRTVAGAPRKNLFFWVSRSRRAGGQFETFKRGRNPVGSNFHIHSLPRHSGQQLRFFCHGDHSKSLSRGRRNSTILICETGTSRASAASSVETDPLSSTIHSP